MSGSNVVKLAELQQRAASEAPDGRDPREILQDLDALGAEPDLEQVEPLTAELVRTLGGAKQLSVTRIREEYVRLLTGRLHAPARFFDTALVDSAPAGTVSDSEQGRALVFENPTPWPEPVDGGELLADMKETIRRFAVLGEAALSVLALWIAHTCAFDIAWITPRLAITSPEKRCGKTLVLTLLRYLVAKPLMTANASPAAIFRCVEQVRPTLLIDEADTFLRGKDELRGILNSGHQRDGCVLRTVGDDHEPRAFATFAPAAIAMIGQLPDTLADRAIAIPMVRKKPSERVERLRMDRLGPFEELRRRALRWAVDSRDRLAQADPDVPSELNDRAADNWRILLAIADTAGGDWPALARQAAVECSSSKGDDLSARVQLLEDLRSLFVRTGSGRLFSREIVAELIEMEDRPWPEWKAGKPLTLRQLARLLQPFGVKPRHLRIEETMGRGYALEDLEEAFARYLVSPNRNKRNNPLESTSCEDSRSVTPGGPVTDREEGLEPMPTGVVTDVTDRDGGSARSPREVIEL